MGTPLEQDAKAYEKLLPELLKTDSGRFVLIRAADRVGVYDSYEAALSVGYDRFGFDPFFVKEIAPDRVGSINARSISQACPT